MYACTLLVCSTYLVGCAARTMREVAESHVEGNAPKAAAFETTLERDLTKYFVATHGKGVAVQHEFLRQGATQTGISYPKYYLWVKVTRAGMVIDEGAVRCAAIETTHFEVTHFLAKSSLLSDPGQAKSVFPAAVCERITEKVKG